MPAQTNISIPDRSLYAIAAGLVAFACAMVSGNALLRDPDVLSHLAVGRWILDHRTVPAQDVFSHSMPGAPWVAHEWLTEILMARLYGALGFAGLVAAAAFCFGLALALLAHALLRWLSPLHALIGVALAAAMCVPHLFARPHLVSYPFLVAWTAMLVLVRSEQRAPSLWWCLLIILWANLHASFLFGLVLAAFFAAEAAFDATSWRAALRAAGTWLPFCLLSLLAGLATPYMLEGLTYPIHHAQLAFALSWIAEWQSPNMQELHPTGIWILLVLLAALFLGLRLPITRIAMLLVLVHMALKHQRHGELLGLLAPLLVAPALATQLRAGPALGPWPSRGALAFALAAAVTATLWAAPRIRLAPYYAPATALRSVDRAGLTGHVFNDYGFGGYLMFTGRQPFIDGRIDMYGDGLLRRFVDTAGLPALLDEYRIDWTLLRPTSPHLPLLDRLAGWQRLYADDIAVVHVRTVAKVGPGRR